MRRAARAMLRFAARSRWCSLPGSQRSRSSAARAAGADRSPPPARDRPTPSVNRSQMRAWSDTPALLAAALLATKTRKHEIRSLLLRGEVLDAFVAPRGGVFGLTVKPPEHRLVPLFIDLAVQRRPSRLESLRLLGAAVVGADQFVPQRAPRLHAVLPW